MPDVSFDLLSMYRPPWFSLSCDLFLTAVEFFTAKFLFGGNSCRYLKSWFVKISYFYGSFIKTISFLTIFVAKEFESLLLPFD